MQPGTQMNGSLDLHGFIEQRFHGFFHAIKSVLTEQFQNVVKLAILNVVGHGPVPLVALVGKERVNRGRPLVQWLALNLQKR
jgi:hypothetical protein